jgi:hypothetical protein
MRRWTSALSRTEIVWISVLIVLGLTSAAFAFAAQATRVKADEVRLIDGLCYYPHSPAVWFALIAALILLAAQIILNAVGGCLCCARGPNGLLLPHSPTRSIATLSLLFAWIAFFNGFVSLLAGASLNSPGRNNTPPNGYRCYVVGPLVFVAGGLLSIATVVFGVNYYILSSSLRKSTWGNTLPQHGQDGIVMGQPAYGGAQPYIPQEVIPPQAYTFQPFPQGTQYSTVQYPGPSYPIYGQDSHAK